MRISNESQSSYPPYNIWGWSKVPNRGCSSRIDKKDVEIELCDSVLTVSYGGPEEGSENDTLHRGIAKELLLKFTLAEDLEVVGATSKNGLLKIDLEKILPDHKKPRVINIK